MALSLEELKRLAETGFRGAVGTGGNVINAIGGLFNNRESTSNSPGSIDWSSTFQNWGGNKAGSGFGLVKVANAAENPPKVIKRNMSGDGGYYDGDGNFTPYFAGTTNLDTSKKQSVTEKQGGGGDNGGGGNDEKGNLESEAERLYNIARNKILSKLQIMKDEAVRLKNSARGSYDFTKGEIGRNYGALQELSKEKLQQAMEGLDREDVNVKNMYGRVAGNVRRAMESAGMKTRMLHRAQGSLGSSFYTDAQTDNLERGTGSLSDNASEEALKRGAIGTQRSSTNTDFAQNDVAIEAEKNALTQRALDDYNTAIANADNLSKNYNIDSVAEIEAADAQLESSLKKINSYISDKSIANQSSGATTGGLAQFAKQYDPVSTISPTLNNNYGINAASKYIADTGSKQYSSNPQSMVSDNSFLNLQNQAKANRLAEEERKRLGYYQA